MKVSIITVVFNGAKTIEDCIKSVLGQTYSNIAYIIIDGGSTDGTLDIVKRYGGKISKVISEPDNGIYDAMNKGINAATGEIIGILNSDDIYADELVIENVVKTMAENNADSCYGDLVYVDKADTNKVIRYWESGNFSKEEFKKGWMPPHPALFIKKDLYNRHGIYNTDFPIAADYELILRFLYKHGSSTTYIPKVFVKMRIGGTSNPGLTNTFKAIMENYKAWKLNNLDTNLLTFLLKPLRKIFQYIQK